MNCSLERDHFKDEMQGECTGSSYSGEDWMDDPYVLIIGAGAAGVAAAGKLLEAGLTNVLILEAQGRIGGRVHTLEHGENILELGAQWIHGQENNVVYEMALQSNVTDESFSLEQSGKGDATFVTDSGVLIDPVLCENFQCLMDELSEKADEVFPQLDKHVSVGEYYHNELKSHLDEGTDVKIDEKYAYPLLDWHHRFMNCIDGSYSWFETSACGHMQYLECEGNPLVNWTSGYKTLFDILMKKIPDPKEELPMLKKVILNKPVTQIIWSSKTGSPQYFSETKLNMAKDQATKKKDDVAGEEVSSNDILVECADGSTYHVNHVIVTSSLGVLKSKAEKMFVPCLPQKKMDAIRGLAMGTVDKIYLRFPYQWWPDTCKGFSFVWMNPPKREDLEYVNWQRGLLGAYTVRKQKDWLCFWITGHAAEEMELLSDATVMSECMSTLKQFVGAMYNIPQPSEIIMSCWHENPWSQGSYSYRSVESEKMDVWPSDLAEPLTNSDGKPIVMFAGEATHSHYYSTVHGAVESGMREADRIINWYRTSSEERNSSKL